MSYTSKDIKNIVAEILENKKDKGGVKSLYFVGCGGSLGALYPAKTFMEKECSNIKSALINSNEFVHSTPKDFGENSIICLSCHKGNTPETIAAAKLGKEKKEQQLLFLHGWKNLKLWSLVTILSSIHLMQVRIISKVILIMLEKKQCVRCS